MTIAERARAVRSQADLAAFVDALRDDLATNEGEWTNTDLATFLEAMAAWVDAMDGFYANHGEDMAKVSPWRMMADILMGARLQE